jgi:AcrR family transcriptional regulator
MDAVQIAPVAARAGIAAGTVYRYFPSKTALVEALALAATERELAHLRNAAATAPGPVSALAAVVATFATRSAQDSRLTWALLAAPVDAETDQARRGYRQAVTAEIEARLSAAITDLRTPDSDPALLASAILGALLEGLIGPLAPGLKDHPAKLRETVQMLTLFALRGLGAGDARARGLVVQTVLPIADADTPS